MRFEVNFLPACVCQRYEVDFSMGIGLRDGAYDGIYGAGMLHLLGYVCEKAE